jgi:hypothetical protein
MYIGDAKFELNLSRPIRVAAGVCGLCLSCSAVASPPFSWGGTSASAIVSARSTSQTSRPVVRREYAPTTNLDLRPPGVLPSPIIHEGASAPVSEPFPSSTQHLNLGNSDRAANERTRTRALGLGEMDFRVMSQAEIFTRRVRQEGLPIARLFESKSALLSIGLNKRGKPGLWFTQKTH